MALYISKIVFTGQEEKRKRPEPMTVVIRARTLELAAKRTAKFAKRRYNFWRFDVELADCDVVLK